jgi:flagellum-specific peptidoglycan hydrolase FlgJ
VVLSTYEGGGDTLVRAKARFREYSDWRESLAHHNRLLSTDHRYADARAHWMDWQAFVDELAPVYATDPAYVRSVSQIVKKYDLDAWDDLVAQRVAHAKP